MELDIVATRLATAERLTDRFVTAAFYKPTSPNLAKQGNIFYVIEMLNPWFPSSQVGHLIANTAIREYYRLQSAEPLQNFEGALRKVNAILSQLVSRGQTDWLGSLNAVLGLAVGNQVHLTQAGGGQAFLVKQKTLSEITEPPPQELKTLESQSFSSITSGTLRAGDRLVVTTPTCFGFVTEETLAQLVGEQPVGAGALALAQELKAAGGKTVNLLLIGAEHKGYLDSLPVNATPEVLYLDQRIDALVHTGARAFKGVKAPLQKTAATLRPTVHRTNQWVKRNYQTRAVPGAKIFVRWLQNQSGRLSRFSKNARAPAQDARSKEHALQSSPPIAVIQETPLPQGLAVRHYAEQTSTPRARFKDYLPRSAATFLASRNRRAVLIALAAIVLVVLGLSVVRAVRLQRDKSQATQNTATTEELAKILGDANTALIYKETERAKTLFSHVIALAAQNSSPQGAAMRQEAQDKLDSLTATIQPQESSAVFVGANLLIAVLPAGGSIVVVEADGTVQRLLQSGPEKAGAFPSSPTSVAASEGTLWALTGNQVSKMAFSDGTVKAQNPTRGSWASADKIFFFADNLYLMQKTGALTKYGGEDDGFGAGAPFGGDGLIAGGAAVDFAIDGSVWVLTGDGGIEKYSRAGKLDFTLAPPPTPSQKIAGPVALYVTDTNLLVLDTEQRRVVRWDKQGAFVDQIRLPADLQAPGAFLLRDKALYVASAQTLWLLTLP